MVRFEATSMRGVACIEKEALVIALDTETTGFGVDAQMIEFAILEYTYGELTWQESYRFRPTVAITAEARKRHKIWEADLAGEDVFGASWARWLRERFEKATTFVGYSAAFDLDVVNRDFRRVGVEELDLRRAHLIDPLLIWRTCGEEKQEKTLADATVHFLGAPHDHAHEALGDAFATMAVLPAMLKAFSLTDTSAADLTTQHFDNRLLRLDSKFALVGDRLTFDFHKDHKGKSIFCAPNFLAWMIDPRGDKPFTEHTRRVATFARDHLERHGMRLRCAQEHEADFINQVKGSYFATTTAATKKGRKQSDRIIDDEDTSTGSSPQKQKNKVQRRSVA